MEYNLTSSGSSPAVNFFEITSLQLIIPLCLLLSISCSATGWHSYSSQLKLIFEEEFYRMQDEVFSLINWKCLSYYSSVSSTNFMILSKTQSSLFDKSLLICLFSSENMRRKPIALSHKWFSSFKMKWVDTMSQLKVARKKRQTRNCGFLIL